MAMMHGQAEALLPMVEEVVREAGLTAAAINLVAVTTGPGSFTGIRVGIAAARGIALARGLPLIGVSSFEAVAETVPSDALAGGRLLVVLESRRADLYVQFFDPARRPLSEPAARLPETLATAVTLAEGDAIAIAGAAAARAAAALGGPPNAKVIEAALPPVAGVVRAALRRWRCGERSGPVRPLYLRPPDVTLPGGQRPPSVL
jgi:tRNA threonylcarbamoyladenosine biosynthesis protein TsaB